MNKYIKVCSSFFLLLAANANAGLIDFETTASGAVPTDNGVIEFSDAFMAGSVTVRFGFDSDSDGTLDTQAVFEQVSNVDAGEDTGFWSLNNQRDKAAASYVDQLGDFFLRQHEPYKPFGTFVILYDSMHSVSEASGEIWDIDGRKKSTERFLVKAFSGNTLLDSIESPIGNNKNLDGKPWVFGFTGLTDITRLEITFTGTKERGIGLAFNNFSPVEDISTTANVPEPSMWSMVLMLVFVLFWLRRLLRQE